MKRFACSGSLALMLASIITATILLFPAAARSQAPEWVVFNTENSGLPHNDIRCLAIDAQGHVWIGSSFYSSVAGGYRAFVTKFDGANWTVYDSETSGLPAAPVHVLAFDAYGNKWIGTYGPGAAGLAKFDGMNWTVYHSDNSGLPAPSVASLAIDVQGNLWVGTAGLVKFDGVNWTVYNSDNSGLPAGLVNCLAMDAQGNVWIGGISWSKFSLVKFDGVNWTEYTTDNSGLPHRDVHSLVFDVQGNLWIGTFGGLGKFDGTDWTEYNVDNSGLPDSRIGPLAIDGQGRIWIGTGLGLVEFDGVTWRVYNTDNSGLPDNRVRWDTPSPLLAIDAHENVWIGTPNGLAVYREGGVILPGIPTAVEETHSTEVPSAFSLSQNHPNPFNPETTITYDIAETGTVRLSVYALTGQLVRTLIDGEHPTGSYSLTWDGTDDAGRDVASGVYVCRMEAGDYRAVRKLVLVQ